MAETTIQTSSLRKTTAQRRWDNEQDGHAEVLHGPRGANGPEAHKHALLPRGFGRPQSNLRLPMVRGEPAKNRLGARMDRYNAATPHPPKYQCDKTTVQSEYTQPARPDGRRSPLH